MAKRHYTIYCDESAKKGPYFSNFYGGALLRSADREAIERILAEKKAELNIAGEMKWTKITKNYQDKYIEFIRTYFEFIRTGRIKIRIMFTHNYRRARNLTDHQKDNQYFLLYYQMVKHAFGLSYSNPNLIDRIYISMLLDEIPHTREKLEIFRKHIENIENTASYRGKFIYFQRGQIADVNSKDHNILQGLDIILGSIYFRLNNFHKEKEEGKPTRGKRTIAKEKVYKEINRQIRSIYPNFNIGTTTGTPNGETDRWEHHYRHWCFKPADHEIDVNAVKPR
ncbi:DUF3800 domain-containing protein [Rhizobium sp. LEGMi135b]